MYVCVCVCVYVCVCVCVYCVCVCVYTYTYLHTCVYAYIEKKDTPLCSQTLRTPKILALGYNPRDDVMVLRLVQLATT